MRQRLLCTYLGPGTEWLDHSNVKREGLRKGNNDNIVKDYSKVNKSKPFELLHSKALYMGRSERGLFTGHLQLRKMSLFECCLKLMNVYLVNIKF